MSADWHWINLPGDRSEQVVADLEALTGDHEDGNRPGTGRGLIVIQTNATSSFHVSFSQTDALPIRGSDVPSLRFVVGKRQNSMTSVGLGNPYLKKEPIDFTRQSDALLTNDPEKSRTYWFLYDRFVSVAAMGVQGAPQADVCRLLCRFRDALGFRAEVCEQVRYVVISSGKRPVSLRVVHIGAPPDIRIPRYQPVDSGVSRTRSGRTNSAPSQPPPPPGAPEESRPDPVTWEELPWQGCSCVFQLDERHMELMKRVQTLLSSSPLGPLYQLVPPECICLNAVRLLDPFRRPELIGQSQSIVTDSSGEEINWRACYEEVHRRLEPIFHSAPWTYWPMQFDRADCTSVTLTPAGPGAQDCVTSWVKAVEEACGLRNAATPREMLTFTFAIEVFPVEGENVAKVRRDLVREIKTLLEKEWNVMDFRCPTLALWQTKTTWLPFEASYLPVSPTPPDM